MKLTRATRGLGLVAAIGWLAASPAAGQADVDAQIRLGGRTITGDWDSSKFEEYRDLRPGWTSSLDFLIQDPSGKYFLRGDAANASYHDQRYSLEAGRFGLLRLYVEYQEIPHVYSNAGRTLYTATARDVLELPAGVQAYVQGAPSTALRSDRLREVLTGTSPLALPGAAPTSLAYQVRAGQAGLVFNPREDVQFETRYRILDRSGTRGFSMGFGSPGGNFAYFAKPVNEQTDEVSADLRLARGPWNLELGYLGSFYDNSIHSVTVDNPLRDVDATNASSRGRVSGAPDNSMNGFHLTGAYQLPLAFPARIAATLSYGLRIQNDEFLPHTINSTLAPVPACATPTPGACLLLPRTDLDGKVKTYLADTVLTARPLPELDLRARYRFYALDNRTPVLHFPAHAINDQGLEIEPRRNVPNEYERQLASLDASYRITPSLKLRAGPFWERWARSSDREVSELDEYGAKAALDYRPTTWASIRADYSVGVRQGTDYTPWDYIIATHPDPTDAADAVASGQLALLRKLDEADRTRNEVRLHAQAIPRDDLDLGISAGWSHSEYPHSEYGLRNDERWNAGLDLGYQPFERLSLTAWYSYEHSDMAQRSRWRPGSGINRVENDWTSATIDQIHALGASLELAIVPDRLDLSLSYTFESGTGKTHSDPVPGCVASSACLIPAPGGPVPPPPPSGSADGGNAADAPDLEDRLHVLTTTLRFRLDEHFSFEAIYSWQKLELDDFHVDGLDPFMPLSNVNGSNYANFSTDVFLGDRVGGYDAHIIGLIATYDF